MKSTKRSVSQTPASRDILNSWKEISSYMGAGIRTVQRWEAEQGLPVRRPHGRRKSAVLAIRSELDEWRRLRTEQRKNGASGHAEAALTDVPVTMKTARLNRVLRSEVRQSQREFSESLKEFAKALGAMLAPGSNS